MAQPARVVPAAVVMVERETQLIQQAERLIQAAAVAAVAELSITARLVVQGLSLLELRRLQQVQLEVQPTRHQAVTTYINLTRVAQ